MRCCSTGAITNRCWLTLIAAMSRDGQPPKFIPISESEAIAQRLPAYEIDRDRWPERSAALRRGRPRASRPSASRTTSWCIRASMSRQPAIWRASCFGIRSSLAAEFLGHCPHRNAVDRQGCRCRGASRAAAYFDGTQKNFFDRYSDFFYLTVMLVSIVGSAAAGLVTYSNSTNRQSNKILLNRLLEIASPPMARRPNWSSTRCRTKPMRSSSTTIAHAAERPRQPSRPVGLHARARPGQAGDYGAAGSRWPSGAHVDRRAADGLNPH